MDEPAERALDERMMRRCFDLAAQAVDHREYPYGAVIVRKGEVVAESANRVARDRDVTRHAEMVAIAEAQKATGSTNLDDCTIYTNIEPCALCSYAIRESRIAKVVFAMRSPIMGGSSRWNILGDRKLSDAMPEIFTPPPVVVADFLNEEADAMLRRAAPVMWTFIRAWGLLDTPSPHAARAPSTEPPGSRGIVAAAGRLIRALLDQFGRGGAGPRG